MVIPITASMLYDLVQCPQRLNLDLHEDPAKRDPESKFVQLLWEKGTAFEKEVIQNLGIPFTDLSEQPYFEREHLTEEATERGDQLIYSGRICAGNLLGEPDLLRKQGEAYVAGDIKSGAGEEGASDLSDGKPKRHYAVQLALYTDILEKKGISAGRYPFIWDIHGQEVVYDLDAPQGPRTPASLWNVYESCLKKAIGIISQHTVTLPALGGTCKLCHWHSVCTSCLEDLDDLSLIPQLGRANRDRITEHVPTVSELASIDIEPMIRGTKTIIKKVGARTLRKYQERARLQVDPEAKPYLKQQIDFPQSQVELFFDIEVDPMRDICYLHGFLERRAQNNSTEQYVYFFAEDPTPEEERRIFAEAWEYIQSCQPCTIYYYSKYERTWWRKLQEKYSGIMTDNEVEAMYHPAKAVDLYYDVVFPHSVWPTRDHSIKTLAAYLGFEWRDSSPSGAESIEWYHRWVESGDLTIRQRILEYNEDDCVATRVLLDGIRGLAVKK